MAADGDEPGLQSEAFRPRRERSLVLLIVILALGLLPVLALAISVRSNHAVLYGRWYLGYELIVVAASELAALWLWRLRRRGAWLAWVTLLSNTAFSAFLGEATVLSAALPVGLCLAIALEYRDLA